MFSIITNPTMSWLPWTIFASFLTIGALIGFWNGWRTATYFLGWNLLFLIVGVLLFDAFYGALVNFAKEFMPKPSAGSNGQNFGEALDGAKTIIKPILGTILMIPVLLVGNFLAFLIYWFFRKNLKRRIKDNKQAQLSNIGVRFVGAGVGVITAFPITVFATTASTIVSPQNKFNKVTDFMTSGISFTKFSGTYEAVKSTQDAIAMIGNQKALMELGKAFGGKKGFDANQINDPKAHKSIQRILDNPQLMGVLPGLAKQMMGTSSSNVDDIDGVAKSMHTKFQAAKFKPFTVGKEAGTKLKKMVADLIKKQDGTSYSETKIHNFLKNSGLINFI